MNERKDHLGRNTVNKLKYYTGAFSQLNKGYKNLNIHEKIAVRTILTGNENPSSVLTKYKNR